MLRRVEGLLARFLAEEARRETGGFEPWLLEAGFGEAEETERPALEIDGWRLHGAIDRVDRGAGRPRPRPRLQALAHGHPAREARGAGEAAAAALPDRGRRALGRGGGRRPLPPAARDLGAPPAGRRPRRRPPSALASYGLSRDRRWSTRGVRGAARRRPPPGGRDRRAGCAPATSTATPARGPGLRGHDVCPAFCDFAPICRRDRAPGRGDGRGRGGRAVSGRAPTAEQRRGDRGRGPRADPVEAGAGTGKTGVMVDRYCRLVCERGRLPRRGARLHLHRQGRGRAAPADPRRARAARRAGLRAGRASCSPAWAAPG